MRPEGRLRLPQPPRGSTGLVFRDGRQPQALEPLGPGFPGRGPLLGLHRPRKAVPKPEPRPACRPWPLEELSQPSI